MTTLLILGMRNNASRETVAAALEAVTGVSDAQVSLFRGLATVQHTSTCAPTDLVFAVLRAGFGAAVMGADQSATP